VIVEVVRETVSVLRDELPESFAEEPVAVVAERAAEHPVLAAVGCVDQLSVVLGGPVPSRGPSLDWIYLDVFRRPLCGRDIERN
jgi:hypothetical protein